MSEPFQNHAIMGDGTYARLVPSGCLNRIREADGHISCDHSDAVTCFRTGHETIILYEVQPISAAEFNGWAP